MSEFTEYLGLKGAVARVVEGYELQAADETDKRITEHDVRRLVELSYGAGVSHMCQTYNNDIDSALAQFQKKQESWRVWMGLAGFTFLFLSAVSLATSVSRGTFSRPMNWADFAFLVFCGLIFSTYLVSAFKWIKSKIVRKRSLPSSAGFKNPSDSERDGTIA